MKNQEIEEAVKKVLSDKLGGGTTEIALSSLIEEDLGADSLDKVEITMALEDKFGIKISNEDAKGIVKVKDAVEYIKEKTKPPTS